MALDQYVAFYLSMQRDCIGLLVADQYQLYITSLGSNIPHFNHCIHKYQFSILPLLRLNVHYFNSRYNSAILLWYLMSNSILARIK